MCGEHTYQNLLIYLPDIIYAMPQIIKYLVSLLLTLITQTKSASPTRVAAITLAISAAAGYGWIGHEGYTSTAVIPTPGDRPTIGHGSTYWHDGTPVKMGDTITREAARELALGELDRTYAQCVRESLGSTLVTQSEFDQAVLFAGQYGCAAWKRSSMLRLTKAGQYGQACDAHMLYKYIRRDRSYGDGWEKENATGQWRYDCSTPGNRVCRGVWLRSQERAAACHAGV